MLILLASMAIMISFFIGRSLPFLRPPQDGVKVKTIESISADITEPDSSVFNDDAINPTVEVIVQGNGVSDTGGTNGE